MLWIGHFPLDVPAGSRRPSEEMPELGAMPDENVGGSRALNYRESTITKNYGRHQPTAGTSRDPLLPPSREERAPGIMARIRCRP